MKNISLRKVNHIKKCLTDIEIDRAASDFDNIKLIHRALPETDFDKIDTSALFLNKKLSFPFMISSMTGGTDRRIIKINRNLAEAAEHCKIAFSTGSQRIMFSCKKAEESFKLRKYAPSIPLIGNIGAVQLNYGFGIEECKKAVDIMEADALFFHLNPLQETVQEGGNGNFAGLAEKIGNINRDLPVPVMVKETGCGMSSSDFALLINQGIRYIDVSGRGGTSWSRIEYLCSRKKNPTGLFFQDWGLTAAESLTEAERFADKLYLIAGGGIRSGSDIAKAMILGARLGAASLPFLKAASLSSSKVIELIENMKQQFKTAMFLLGAKTSGELFRNTFLLRRNPGF